MDQEKYTDSNIIKKLYKLAYIAHNILVKNNIIYYACAGTLLGAIRHSGIIPWDNDLDFCISKNDVKKVLSKDIKYQFLKYGYKIKSHDTGFIQIFDITNKIVHLDLFPTELKLRKNGQWYYEHSTNHAKKAWPGEYIKIDELFPLVKVKFGSGYLLCPNNSINYLNTAYGKSWKKVGYMTINPADHEELEKPIKIIVKKFLPGKKFYKRKQITASVPYILGCPINFL
jgi:lipopolysaccharide cholinephosphotransferase